MATVTILEDDDDRRTAMLAHLAKLRCDVICFDNAPEMIAWLRTNLESVALLSLDHDLGAFYERGGQRFDPGDGRDVAAFLADGAPQCPVIIHSSNVICAEEMLAALSSAGWRAERVLPHSGVEWIGWRWIQRVTELLSEPPRDFATDC